MTAQHGTTFSMIRPARTNYPVWHCHHKNVYIQPPFRSSAAYLMSDRGCCVVCAGPHQRAFALVINLFPMSLLNAGAYELVLTCIASVSGPYIYISLDGIRSALSLGTHPAWTFSSARATHSMRFLGTMTSEPSIVSTHRSRYLTK